MTFLLCGSNKTRQYLVVSPDTYGCETWGCTSQESLEKKRKYWYFTYYTAGNDYIDDKYEEYKAPVLLETKDVDEIINYIDDNCRNKVSAKELTMILQKVVNDIEEIFEDWIKIERFILKGTKEDE